MTIVINPIASKENETVRKRIRGCVKNACSLATVEKRLPITRWIPKYAVVTLIQDIIAGITVGLTAIPQGIAYAVVAGLSPEYGLYAGLMGGFVYCVFGSCKDITVGPTAIMSALVAKYVSDYGTDFAVLAAFLSGIIVLLMGIFNLGFLVDFISAPVISGFTTAAALQIASAQLKSLFGLTGPSGNYFGESMYNFFKNIPTIKLWDTILGFVTIGILVALKYLGRGCKRTDGLTKQLRWFISLGRNAVVVIIGMIIAYIVKSATDGGEPLNLIGEIGSGLPEFKIPPFETIIGNETYNFKDMINALGPESIVLPLVLILESIAISKAFSGGKQIDATQEMIALGLCNIIGSFVGSMPVTGSFTRTALNHASGVQTPAGGIFTGILIILALSLLTSSFYFIPRASLAGLIITAMFSMIDYTIFTRLWRCSKKELFLIVLTMAVSLSVGLEYGIVSGIVMDALILLYNSAKPNVYVNSEKIEGTDVSFVTLNGKIAYCAAENIRRSILETAQLSDSVVIIDGSTLINMDTTVVSNLMTAVKDLESSSKCIIFFNFKTSIQKMCIEMYETSSDKFITLPHIKDCINAILTESPKIRVEQE